MSVRRDANAMIAIVEDDRAVRNSLEFSLETQGYRVCGFDCAEDALSSQHAVAADCLIIDYALPDMTGTDLLAALRGRGQQCPAIIIASNPSFRCRAEAAAAGAPLVEKPMLGDSLNEHLRALV